ncbi:MAG: tRNA-dihydrouridine synthase [Comamonas sp.]
MRLLLAPMEGLLDFVLRDVLTRVGGVDRCVSEFIRVSGSILPDRVFYSYMPELLNGSKTLAGVPVRAQLLGSDPDYMAANAANLARLNPEGIDLNFGCPAKTVNRHGGGASMLQDPESIAKLVAAVRKAVPAHLPVSAKMRMGFHDKSLMRECALAMVENGACELVVHARTKLEGYRPPAYWELIPEITAVVNVPVVANGEIWNVQDALRCRAQSGCSDVMLGRGSVADPGLALALRAALAQGCKEAEDVAAELPPAVAWADMLPHLQRFWWMVCRDLTPNQRGGRLKQWLNLMRRRYPEAETAFQSVRVLTQQSLIAQWLEQECARYDRPFTLEKQELLALENQVPESALILKSFTGAGQQL